LKRLAGVRYLPGHASIAFPRRGCRRRIHRAVPSLPCPRAAEPDWLHEVKFDGYRAMIRRDGADVRLFTRRGYDWTERFPAIVNAAKGIEVRLPTTLKIRDGVMGIAEGIETALSASLNTVFPNPQIDLSTFIPYAKHELHQSAQSKSGGVSVLVSQSLGAARIVRGNPRLEADAWEIRKRAEDRIGELSAALEKSKGGSNPRSTLPTSGKSKAQVLEDAGISTS
jgi:hypothetical protein